MFCTCRLCICRQDVQETRVRGKRKPTEWKCGADKLCYAFWKKNWASSSSMRLLPLLSPEGLGVKEFESGVINFDLSFHWFKSYSSYNLNGSMLLYCLPTIIVCNTWLYCIPCHTPAASYSAQKKRMYIIIHIIIILFCTMKSINFI